MFVGKQFDIVLGVDIHIVQPPGPVPPVPIPHPFVGMVYDPMEFVPILGASILANGIPRAQAGTTVKATVPHIPIGGVFVKPPSNDGELFMGSISVPSEGEPFSFLGCPVLTCQDAGMVSIPRPNRKSKSKPKSLVLPMSVLLPVPKGGANVTPTGVTISLLGMAIKAGLKKLGKVKKVKKAKKVPLNSKKAPYPKTNVNGFGDVPFPKPPFKPNNSKKLRSAFTQAHKKDFKKWWKAQGRPWPRGRVEIHHIKPLAHGGNNSFSNLVPLTHSQHKPFTKWWRSF